MEVCQRLFPAMQTDAHAPRTARFPQPVLPKTCIAKCRAPMNDQPDGLPITGGPVIPFGELLFTYGRSPGPGGQHVNKTNTRAQLRFDLARSPSLSDEQKRRARSRLASRLTSEGHLLLHSSQTRSQVRNREDCLQRLAQLLAEALRPPPPPRRRTRPGRAAVARRLDSKNRKSQKKGLRRRPPTDG